MIRSFLVGAFLLTAGSASAFAQGLVPTRPNSAPLETMQRARSYSVANRSTETIVAAHAKMTNGQERDLSWNEPLRPQQGRNVALPSDECLSVLTIKFQSGRTMQTGSPDCRLTRITVTNDALQVGSNGTDRPAN